MLKVILATAALALFTAVAPPIVAKDKRGVEVVVDVWCDTAQQIEDLYKAHLGSDKMDIRVAVELVNKKAKDPTACAIGGAIGVDKGEVRRFVTGTHLLGVNQFLVYGIVSGGHARKVPMKVWYRMHKIARLLDT